MLLIVVISAANMAKKGTGKDWEKWESWNDPWNTWNTEKEAKKKEDEAEWDTWNYTEWGKAKWKQQPEGGWTHVREGEQEAYPTQSHARWNTLTRSSPKPKRVPNTPLETVTQESPMPASEPPQFAHTDPTTAGSSTEAALPPDQALALPTATIPWSKRAGAHQSDFINSFTAAAEATIAAKAKAKGKASGKGKTDVPAQTAQAQAIGKRAERPTLGSGDTPATKFPIVATQDAFMDEASFAECVSAGHEATVQAKMVVAQHTGSPGKPDKHILEQAKAKHNLALLAAKAQLQEAQRKKKEAEDEATAATEKDEVEAAALRMASMEGEILSAGDMVSKIEKNNSRRHTHARYTTPSN